jgi:hypothetical protein
MVTLFFVAVRATLCLVRMGEGVNEVVLDRVVEKSSVLLAVSVTARYSLSLLQLSAREK